MFILHAQINILRNKEDLLNHLPKELLPKDYGGDLPPLSEIRGKLFVLNILLFYVLSYISALK